MDGNYVAIIEEISDTYSKVGYSRLWGELEFLKKDLGSFHFGIVSNAVNKFLSEHNRNANSPLFGPFSKEDIKDLAEKCQNEETIENSF